jgi:excisionase family DNA binding protein
MVDQNFVERLAKALAARIIPELQNGKPYPRLLNAKQAAVYIGRPSEASVHHLVKRREIPCVKHGRSLRFDRLELDKWIEADTVRHNRLCSECCKRKKG